MTSIVDSLMLLCYNSLNKVSVVIKLLSGCKCLLIHHPQLCSYIYSCVMHVQLVCYYMSRSANIVYVALGLMLTFWQILHSH